MRSLLFVPGDSERKLAKAGDTGADAVIIDLEDSVAADRKDFALGCAKTFLNEPHHAAQRLVVRINPLAGGTALNELRAVTAPALWGVMLPKAEGGADVARLDALLRVVEAEAGLPDGGIRILAIATETARGVLACATYHQSGPRLAGLAWGAEDLLADIGALHSRLPDGEFTPPFAAARNAVLFGAAAAGVAAAMERFWPANVAKQRAMASRASSPSTRTRCR
jgi:citrate lyase subunit beta / citryl-CoA lyase